MNGLRETDASWSAVLAEQVRTSSRLLYRLAHGVLHDAAAAEDVCQQAFLKAWHRRGELRNRDALRSWLARTVVNEALQVSRRRRAERAALVGRGTLDTHVGVAVDDAELRHAIDEALLRLPELPRLVVVLRVMQGMSGNDVRELLGGSASAVSRALHRGMEQLRTELLGRHVSITRGAE